MPPLRVKAASEAIMSVVIRPMLANDHAALIELKWELNRVEIATMPDGHPLRRQISHHDRRRYPER